MTRLRYDNKIYDLTVQTRSEWKLTVTLYKVQGMNTQAYSHKHAPTLPWDSCEQPACNVPDSRQQCSCDGLMRLIQKVHHNSLTSTIFYVNSVFRLNFPKGKVHFK